jgi:hypothetical protein
MADLLKPRTNGPRRLRELHEPSPYSRRARTTR